MSVAKFKAPGPKNPHAELYADLDQEGQDWLTSLDDNVLACRGQQHSWPKLRPGKISDKRIKITYAKDGCYVLREYCEDCPKYRWKLTLPGGVLDPGARWSYNNPPGYAAPKDSGVTRADCVAELWRRIHEEVVASASSGVPVPTPGK